MVDPHDQVARQTSQAEPGTEREFRNIRRDRHKRDTSTRQAQHRHQQLAKPRGNSKPLRAGRRSGRPLRGGFVSMRGISQAEPGTERDFRNIRRDRHKRDASTRQAQHRHQQIPFPYRHARADTAVRGFHVTASGMVQRPAPTIGFLLRLTKQFSNTHTTPHPHTLGRQSSSCRSTLVRPRKTLRAGR
jgi:hypothetical protein